MPYIQGAGTIDDVYHSPNVFANNVQIALWLSPGDSGAFQGVAIDASVEFPNPAKIVTATTIINNYVANPSAYQNNQAAYNGVKAQYPGTVDDGMTQSTSTGLIAEASTSTGYSDIIPALNSILEEAKRGMWRESGQKGRPSNPNILKIWQSLGYPNSSPWTTDQTPWCMGFVQYVLKLTGYRYVQTAWAYTIRDAPSKWNATQVRKEQAQPGDIALWSFGHVNFVYQNSGGRLSFVGGNQTPTSGKNNNPDDGDVTISWPGPACSPSNNTLIGCWRPSKT